MHSETETDAALFAPYLTVVALAMLASAIGYGTGTIDAAGLYALMIPALLIAGIGAARWEHRHPHRQ
jgi:hypothetical protein